MKFFEQNYFLRWASFFIEWYANKQNCCTWGDINIRAIHELPIYLKKLLYGGNFEPAARLGHILWKCMRCCWTQSMANIIGADNIKKKIIYWTILMWKTHGFSKIMLPCNREHQTIQLLRIMLSNPIISWWPKFSTNIVQNYVVGVCCLGFYETYGALKWSSNDLKSKRQYAARYL